MHKPCGQQGGGGIKNFEKLSTVSPRIVCKFVPKNHRAIRNRAVRDYYLLVSDPNEFKNRAIVRNFTIKSHYLRNFSLFLHK